MKKSLLIAGVALSAAAQAQIKFDPSIQVSDFAPPTVVMPTSPLKMQVLFVGGHDYVQVGQGDSVLAKQWHDFIGFTEDPNSNDLGWVTVNHEMIEANDKIGDGGGMTSFKIARVGDSIVIVPQTLTDGRSGRFFNVDFSSTGETGMNCGGIVGPTGRIWTAEEWWQGSNSAIYAGGAGIRDTSDYTISGSGISFAEGQTVRKVDNVNYMTEIDPINAVAIRKQYNWGRQPFEGGAIAADNKTVYLGQDDTPGFFSKFVATTAGDFTSGNLYVYKQDATGSKWIQINNSSMSDALSVKAQAIAAEATMFNRIEWFAIDPATGIVYFTETGRDNPAGRWADEHAAGAVHANHHMARATAQNTHPDSSAYWDYYGRVIQYDPSTEVLTSFLEGGPYLPVADPQSYPTNHLSNPDGLTFMTINGTSYMVIQEDLNGRSYGRVPDGVNNSFCELYMYDMSDPNPALNKLMRITGVPAGAEITGARAIDGNTLLVDCQHPSSSNPFPFNNSLTFAISGFETGGIGLFEQPSFEGNGFQIYPNPATRELFFNETTDVAIYDVNGRRVNVFRNVERIDVTHLTPGVYFVKNAEGDVQRLVIQ
ncbi:MAG: DUF839 domain-containing protein [Bacteroidetes bacterium]|nr:MAG: DUF839 domain-containing protein [Bacteroidota bacterium]